jgi:5-keto 4-deoxyuronate isomerase
MAWTTFGVHHGWGCEQWLVVWTMAGVNLSDPEVEQLDHPEIGLEDGQGGQVKL